MESEDDQIPTHGSLFYMVPGLAMRDPNLSPGAKNVLGVIASKCNEYSYCTVMNCRFAQWMGVTIRMVQKWMAQLVQQGYIHVELVKSPHGIARRITLLSSKIKIGHEPEFMGSRTRVHGVMNQSSHVIEVRNRSKDKNIPPPSGPPSADADRLADFFLQQINQWNPTYPMRSRKRWVADLDLMLQRDKVDAKAIEEAIVWVQTNPFWRKVVLSPGNLRKQWDRLKAERISDAQRVNGRGISSQSNPTLRSNKDVQLLAEANRLYGARCQYASDGIVLGHNYFEAHRGSAFARYEVGQDGFCETLIKMLKGARYDTSELEKLL